MSAIHASPLQTEPALRVRSRESTLTPLRQFLGQSILARVGFTVAILLLLAALFAPWIAPADPAAQDLPPVSYTHLDVYKRQAKLLIDFQRAVP